MLILVSKTAFVSVYTPLVAIRFNASAQLVPVIFFLAMVARGSGGSSAGGRPC
jgi:hypothetical protein